MKRIAVISSDKVLERVVCSAIECSAAVLARAGRSVGQVEVVALNGDGEALTDAERHIAGCDKVVILGSAGFVSGRLSATGLHDAGGTHERRPEIFVISWQHDERTVLGLIDGGVDQYMTFPLSLRRLCVKLFGLR